MNIGQKIRYFREKETLTQEQLAKLLFVSNRTVGHYETGTRTPSIETLKILANLLKVELDDFFKEETKQLMQLHFTRDELIKYLNFRSYSHPYTFLQPEHFITFLESDRFFVQLNSPYKGFTMTFLIWLLDGFFLVPVETQSWEEWDLENEEVFIDRKSFVLFEEMKKVSKSDIDYIQKASGRPFIKLHDEQSFSESIYTSKYDTMDFTISLPSEELFAFEYNLHYFINEETKGLYALDTESNTYYVKSNKGIFKTNSLSDEFDDDGFIVFIDSEMSSKHFLSDDEVSLLKETVLLKEKETRLLYERYTVEQDPKTQKLLSEEYRMKVAFIDKIKRILDIQTIPSSYSFLPDDSEVEKEIKLRKEKAKNELFTIDKDKIDEDAKDKILLIYDGHEFPHSFYRKLLSMNIEHILQKPLLKTFSDVNAGFEFVLTYNDTPYRPNVILLRIQNEFYMNHYLELFKDINEDIKIIVVMPFASGESGHRWREYQKKGADSFLVFIDRPDLIESSIQAAIDGLFKSEMEED